MKNGNFSTLCRTTGIGLLSGLVGGIWLFYAITQNAEERIRELGANSFMYAGSIRCSAGNAAMMLFILSLPAGAIFGLILGGIFLLYKRTRENRLL